MPWSDRGRVVSRGWMLGPGSDILSLGCVCVTFQDLEQSDFKIFYVYFMLFLVSIFCLKFLLNNFNFLFKKLSENSWNNIEKRLYTISTSTSSQPKNMQTLMPYHGSQMVRSWIQKRRQPSLRQYRSRNSREIPNSSFGSRQNKHKLVNYSTEYFNTPSQHGPNPHPFLSAPTSKFSTNSLFRKEFSSKVLK
jgi:hypothetical protein